MNGVDPQYFVYLKRTIGLGAAILILVLTVLILHAGDTAHAKAEIQCFLHEHPDGVLLNTLEKQVNASHLQTRTALQELADQYLLTHHHGLVRPTINMKLIENPCLERSTDIQQQPDSGSNP